MKDIFYNICKQFNLGNLLEEPKVLTGGFMHKMYSLNTESGKYAIKLLNPYVMERKDALQNYENAEKLEEILLNNNIPVVVPIKLNNKKIQKINNQFFYIFNWCNGVKLNKDEIKQYHCEKIGNILAKIHKIDLKEEDCKLDKVNIDWEFYLTKLKSKNQNIYNILNENIKILNNFQEDYNNILNEVPKIKSICHNDMDIKNVLWENNDCYIIDLECLRYSNPFIELLELSLCWSGYEQCNIDFNLFISFIKSYIQAGGNKPSNWKVIYEVNIHRIHWLEFNIKRLLGIEGSEDEEELAISEIINTLKQICYYYNMKDTILDVLNNKL